MSTQTVIPPGGTWFEGLRKSFVDVPVDSKHDNAISTTEFLEAVESLATLWAFTPVKSDMIGNVKKLRERQLVAPMQSETLQSLVINELKTKKHTATEGLVWLVRGLEFTAKGLQQNMAQSTEELSVSFRAAYGTTLKPHHSFMVKPIFSAAMSATPYRKDFYVKLGDNQQKVESELRTWLEALGKQVVILKKFQESKEAKW
ncbi:MAG: hypothetical protein M1827_001891 [Pycnora praestabilis]|nr:MAG: hypothetical protein M1827_001891 [Pycnora praestabilis]